MWSQSPPPPAGPPTGWPASPPPAGPPPPVPPPPGRSRATLVIGLGITAVVVVAVLVVSLVVIGSDDGDDTRADESADDSATDDETDDETDVVFRTIPMDGASPTAPATTTPEPAPPAEGTPVDLSVIQLEDALLSAFEVPQMGAEELPEPQTSDRLTSADMDVTDECRALLEEHEAQGTRPNFGGGPAAAPRYAARRFGEGQMTIEHELADGVDVTIDDYRTLLTTCETIEWDGGTGRLRFVVLEDAPDLGDDALRVEYAFGGSESIVQWVLWSRDSVIASLSVSQVGGLPGASGSDQAGEQLEGLAYQADEALAMVIADR